MVLFYVNLINRTYHDIAYIFGTKLTYIYSPHFLPGIASQPRFN